MLSAQVGQDENAQAEFVQDVTIEQMTVPTSAVDSIDEIELALSGEKSGTKVYAVQQGDTLSQIAENYGMTLEQEGSLLRCGGRLRPGEYTLPGNVSSQYISGLLMALPRLALPSPAPGADSAAETPVPSEPSLAAQTLPDTGQPTQYLLRDEGGMVAVYTCGPDGSPTRLARQTDIYVNLLPENDALRVKQGMTVTGDTALQEVLEDLGG